MRIAICTDQYLPMLSGLVDSVDTLVGALRVLGHEVRIYAPALPGALEDENVFRFPAYPVPGTKGGVILTVPLGAMKDMRQFRPDVVHAHLFGLAGFLAIFAAWRFKVPLVGTDHTFPADYLFKFNFPPFPYLVRKFAAWFYNRCDFVTIPSERMLEELRTHGMYRPTKIISNPVLPIFRPLENKDELKENFGIGKRAIAVFGRVAGEKNLGVALDIFADVAQRSDAELVFIGDGPYRETLEQRVRVQKLEHRVRFLGIFRGEKLVEAINACDVLLITSLSENQPMTLLQAMACGLPVVAARAGGLPEYVWDEITGYTVDADKLHECGDHVVRLLNEPAIAKNFGEAGRKAIAPYSPETIAGEFEEVYKQMILAS